MYNRPKLTADQLRGVELMKQGAKLFFTDDATKELFKHLANADTVLGSYADSGGYVHGNMTPICDYDMISIANVLRGDLLAADSPVTPPTERVDDYRETWKPIY